jgi:hypothetical protein
MAEYKNLGPQTDAKPATVEGYAEDILEAVLDCWQGGESSLSTDQPVERAGHVPPVCVPGEPGNGSCP